MALATYAQPTYADLGLPDEVKPMENCVIQSAETYTMDVSRTLTGLKLVRKKTTPGFTAYCLNFLHDKIHEEGFEFQGVTGGTYKFFKPSVQFSLGYVPAQSMEVHQDLNGRWVIKLKPYTMTYRLIVSAKWVTYTAEQLAALGGITVDQLWEQDADYYYGYDKNPATHITSWFMTVALKSGNTFTSDLWINFKPAKSINYASMVTCYGQTGKTYGIRWATYNDCTGSMFGKCSAVGPISPSDPRAWEYRANYDPTQKYAVIQCLAVETPDDGKRMSTEGYYTIVGCDSDDPCGPSRRLPRTPVQ